MTDIARSAIVAAEPQTGIIPLHAEQQEKAIRGGNRLHGDDEPLAVGLILVLQTQLRTDLSGAEIKAELLGSSVDLLAGGSILEAQLGDADDNQIQLDFLGGRRESGFTEDVVGVATDAESVVPESLAEVVGGPESIRAKIDGLENLELGLNRFDHQLTRQETTDTVVAPKLVENRLNLP